jgi:hypothetical protein
MATGVSAQGENGNRIAVVEPKQDRCLKLRLGYRRLGDNHHIGGSVGIGSISAQGGNCHIFIVGKLYGIIKQPKSYVNI